jgi:hypothetical protein
MKYQEHENFSAEYLRYSKSFAGSAACPMSEPT